MADQPLPQVAPGWQERTQPLEEHERRRLGADSPAWDDLGAMGRDGYPTVFMPGASKFDGGGRTNPITLPMLAPALRQVLAFGPDRIQATLRRHVGKIAGAASAAGLVCPPTRALRHFVGIYHPADLAAMAKSNYEGLSMVEAVIKGNLPPIMLMNQVHAWLKKAGVYCSLRSGSLRVAPHLYNSDEEIARFCGLLVEATREVERGLAAPRSRM